MTASREPLGIAMIGYSFMGAAHSHAWRNAGRVFDLPIDPEMRVICGRTGAAAKAAAERLGWQGFTTDWRDAITRDDIAVVDICTPGDSHAEITIAALQEGKHVLCEKPLANTVDEAIEMSAAATNAAALGVRSMVGFNYRRAPAVTFARDLVAAGRLGTIRHIRALYLQDWIVDPNFPLVWRLQSDIAGSGALGDLGAHLVDLAEFLSGHRLTSVVSTLRTFITRRPISSSSSGLRGTVGTETGPVTVDDAMTVLGVTDGGAMATFEATRFATGRKNALRFEINGSGGSVSFDAESMNELQFYDGAIPNSEAGFARVLVTEPEHPYLSGWWPPGHGLGYDHTFIHEIADLVRAIHGNYDPSPSFAEGLRVQRILDAISRSSRTAGWADIQ
jgi:predicted dehydrogenase